MDLTTTKCSAWPQQIAEKSIRRSRWSRPRGRKLASSIGGSKNGRNGWVGYAVRTAVNGGSELLIFVPRAAHSHDLLSLRFECEDRDDADVTLQGGFNLATNEVVCVVEAPVAVSLPATRSCPDREADDQYRL